MATEAGMRTILFGLALVFSCASSMGALLPPSVKSTVFTTQSQAQVMSTPLIWTAAQQFNAGIDIPAAQPIRFATSVRVYFDNLNGDLLVFTNENSAGGFYLGDRLYDKNGNAYATSIEVTNIVSGTFSPSNIANLTLWLDARSLTGAEGSYVTGWNGVLGLGKATNIVTSASAGAPILRNTGFNGFPTVRFYGTNKLVTTNTFDAGYNSNFTFFVAFQHTNKTPASFSVMAAINGNQWRWNLIAGSALSLADRDVSFFYTAGLNPPQSLNASYPWALTTNTSLAGVFSHNGRMRVFGHNGFEEMETATNSLALSGAMTIGEFGGGSFPSSVDISEILVYRAPLTGDQRAAVIAYLTSRHRIPKAPALVICDGNSLTSGNGLASDLNYPSQLSNSLAGGVHFRNVGQSGQTSTDMLQNEQGRIGAYAHPARSDQVALAWEITNDIHFGSNAVAAYSVFAEYCRLVRSNGVKVIAFTCLPRTTTNVVFEATRNTVNGLLRTNWPTFADALADVAGIAAIGTNGANTNLSFAYYQIDEVHLNANGASLVAQEAAKALRQIVSTNVIR